MGIYVAGMSYMSISTPKLWIILSTSCLSIVNAAPQEAKRIPLRIVLGV